MYSRLYRRQNVALVFSLLLAILFYSYILFVDNSAYSRT
jgi:hypothetical protein